MIDIVMDLETGSLREDAAIYSIGAVAVKDGEIVDEFHIRINPNCYGNRHLSTLPLRQMGLEGKFHSLVSPKYYNFETDTVYVELPKVSLLKIKLEVMLDNREDFSAWVIDNCTSRDGFISFLPNNLALWPEEWEERHYYAALEFLDEGSEDIIEVLRANGRLEIITRSDNS